MKYVMLTAMLLVGANAFAEKGANDGKQGQCPKHEVLSCPYKSGPCKCVSRNQLSVPSAPKGQKAK